MSSATMREWRRTTLTTDHAGTWCRGSCARASGVGDVDGVREGRGGGRGGIGRRVLLASERRGGKTVGRLSC
eukprot:1299774-Pleurochrysis_carterae.AAC.4